MFMEKNKSIIYTFELTTGRESLTGGGGAALLLCDAAITLTIIFAQQ